MTEVIWKYTLDLEEFQCIMMPENSKILTLDIQHDTPTIWAISDTKNTQKPLIPREFQIAGTGHLIHAIEGKRHEYIGTWSVGVFVWHLFEWVKY